MTRVAKALRPAVAVEQGLSAVTHADGTAIDFLGLLTILPPLLFLC